MRIRKTRGCARNAETKCVVLSNEINVKCLSLSCEESVVDSFVGGFVRSP